MNNDDEYFVNLCFSGDDDIPLPLNNSTPLKLFRTSSLFQLENDADTLCQMPTMINPDMFLRYSAEDKQDDYYTVDNGYFKNDLIFEQMQP